MIKIVTTFEEITTRAMTFIKNDRSLQFDLDCRLPVFYNRMNGYLRAARTYFNRPPEILEKTVTGTGPGFAQIRPSTDEAIPAGTEITTAFAGFELCCAGLITLDDFGGAEYLPLTVAAYNSETGGVKLKETVEAGSVLEMCFYSSGCFATELTEPEINILAYATYYIWETRQSNDLLERKAKLRDSSFSTISEASQTQANTERLELVHQRLENMIAEYAETVEYNRVIKSDERYSL